MEQLLLKLARQLDAMDEASLMSLWDKYAAMASRFEPTRRWEEAVLVFALIQGKRWKNQLFNQQWAGQSRPGHDGVPPRASFALESEIQSASAEVAQKRGKVLSFRPAKGD